MLGEEVNVNVNGDARKRKSDYQSIDSIAADDDGPSNGTTRSQWKRKQGLMFVVGGALGAVLLLGLFLQFYGQPSQLAPTTFASKNGKGAHKQNVCKNKAYSKTTLKVAAEQTFMSLINAKDQFKFEASDVVVVNDAFYTICDSSWAIEKVSDTMTPFSPNNMHIMGPDRDKGTYGKNSQYEAIVYDSKSESFLLVREAMLIKDEDERKHNASGKQMEMEEEERRSRSVGKKYRGEYRGVVEEVTVSKDGKTYALGDSCVTEFQFDGEKKGFEGAVGLRDAKGELYLLALCEGNECAEDYKNHEPGNGVAVLMKKTKSKHEGKEKSKEILGDFKCVWKTHRYLKLPSSAYFLDYSAISISSTGRVAVTSQEESQMWIGKMSHWTPPEHDTIHRGQVGLADMGVFDPDRSEFEEDKERTPITPVFNFPRDTNCEMVYCNVEGIHWMSDDLLVAVSDQMKGGGRQDYRCLDKDQSIHIFSLPHGK